MPMSVENALATGVSSAARPIRRLRGVALAVAAVDRARGGVADGAGGAGQRPHRHQHALDVGMLDDRARSGCRAERAALLALAGILQRLLRRPLGDADALQADREAGEVHHGEHAGEPAVLLADQVADRAAVIPVDHGAGGGGVNTELVLDGMGAHVVKAAKRAVLVDEHLGHQEQRDALVAGGRVRQPRQNEMDDVVGKIVLAVGNEDLLPGDAIAAVVRAHRLGAQRADVGAGLRLGELHRAHPFAGHELGQIRAA